MADIKFKATVKSVYDKFLIVYEKHSKKTPTGEWETVGYTDFKVWLPDGLTGSMFKEKDFIEVSGRQKTETVEKDGSKYKNLVVSANVIETVKGSKPSNVAPVLDPIDAPF
jgi:hypothetical protein